MRPLPVDACLALVHAFEGDEGKFEPTRTLDPAGNYEIGWSHKLIGPDDPLWFATLDAGQADALALEDLAKAAEGVCAALGSAVDDLTDNQYAAVIDLAYNIGVGAFAGSTLCHLLVHGNFALAAKQFPLWIHAKVNGHSEVLPGLVRRRDAELDVWRA